MKLFLNERGFTLASVITSLVSLSIVALSSQSLILYSRQFLSQQETSFAAMESSSYRRSIMCTKMKSSPSIQVDRTRTYYYKHSTNTYIKLLNQAAESKYASLSFPLLSKYNGSYNFESSPIIYDEDLSNLGTHDAIGTYLQGDFQNTGKNPLLKEHVDDSATSTTSYLTSTRNYKSKFYDVFSDSHTLISYTIQPSPSTPSIAQLGFITKDDEGVIIASRCVENKIDKTSIGNYIAESHSIGTVMDLTDHIPTSTTPPTSDPLRPTESALYVLEGLEYRPFHFPNESETKNKILCCKKGVNNIASTNITDCKNLDEMTPITYMIQFASEDSHLGANTSLAQESIANYDNSFLAFITNLPSPIKNSFESRHSNIASATSPYTNPSDPEYMTNTEYRDYLKIDLYLEYMKKYYFPELRKKFSAPITFTGIYELPIIKNDLKTSWASGFIAIGFQNMEETMNLKSFEIKNTCPNLNMGGFCPDTLRNRKKPSEMLVKSKTTPRDLLSFFKLDAKDCVFSYRSIQNNGGIMPMGSHFQSGM